MSLLRKIYKKEKALEIECGKEGKNGGFSEGYGIN
jgi:hypothetical protein